MVPEVGRPGKAFPAFRAGIRLLPRVNPLVADQVCFGNKASPALRTGERLLPSVDGLVGPEPRLLPKGFPALWAGKLDVGMSPLMFAKLGRAGETFPALRTWERLLTSMAPLVLYEL